MIICKSSDSCPKGLNICCVTCNDKKICTDVCWDFNEPECDDREEVKDELVELKKMEAVAQLTTITVQMKQLEDQSKELKKKLVEAMEAHGVKKFENDQITITYIAPTTKKTFDKDKLATDYPEINLDAYNKTSPVSASVRIKVK